MGLMARATTPDHVIALDGDSYRTRAHLTSMPPRASTRTTTSPAKTPRGGSIFTGVDPPAVDTQWGPGRAPRGGVDECRRSRS